MFFSDNGPNPRIEKAFLDGQDREVIVFVGLVRVISLSVDVLNKKLYWIDNGKHTLEVSNYDGSSRRVIRLMNNNPWMDIIYYQVKTTLIKSPRMPSYLVHFAYFLIVYKIFGVRRIDLKSIAFLLPAFIDDQATNTANLKLMSLHDTK